MGLQLGGITSKYSGCIPSRVARSNLLGRAACAYHGQASSAFGGLRLTVPRTLNCHSYWDAPKYSAPGCRSCCKSEGVW